MDYDRTGRAMWPARIVLRIEGSDPVIALRIDHVGDGLEAPVLIEGADLRGDYAISLLPVRAQTVGWAVDVLDVCGMADVTGLPREMVITP